MGQWSQRRRFDAFLETLVGYCERRRSVHLELADSWHPHHVFAELRPIPLLQELVLGGMGVEYLQKYDFFKDAPNLHKVVLSDHEKPSIPVIRLLWSQLTAYKATYPNATTHFRNISVAAPTFVECDIDFGRTGFDHFSGRVTLMHLRRLVVSESVFLDCIVAPALQELHVCGSIDRVQPFLLNFACVLTRLSLFMCSETARDFLLLLRNTASVTTLS
jgi:hypothetical protein